MKGGRLARDQLQARLEDLRWMAATGESAAGAARRLHITEISLERWCRRHELVPLWRRLRNRNPLPTEEAA